MCSTPGYRLRGGVVHRPVLILTGRSGFILEYSIFRRHLENDYIVFHGDYRTPFSIFWTDRRWTGSVAAPG
jgi:ERCC4-type nuclease